MDNLAAVFWRIPGHRDADIIDSLPNAIWMAIDAYFNFTEYVYICRVREHG
jgi:hypothetical protein